MHSQQQRLSAASISLELAPQPARSSLLLAFGSATLFDAWRERLLAALPGVVIAGCTTAGEIAGTEISDDQLVLSLLSFDKTELQFASTHVDTAEGSAHAGRDLAKALPAQGLRHVLVFSDGLHINGTPLVAALNRFLPAGVTVTGGLAGDGSRFQHTAVFDNQGSHEHHIIAIGMYGDALQVGCGSLGGWDSFGPDRRITRAEGNVLYELDGQSALGLYKTYLGSFAKELPASALLFPLHVHQGDDTQGVVRTILGMDEARQSLTFAGDMPTGAMARLMRANFDRLIDGATGAAQAAALRDIRSEFALLISCVGRRLLLKQRTEEELESVRDVLGTQAMLSGFYSYGELCPHGEMRDCMLHNQTMTITALTER